MPPEDAARLVSFIGAATQLGGSVLLTAFFLLLRGHAHRRAYFRAWSSAWMWMSLALLAVFTLYRLDWAGAALSERGMWFVYQACKLIFLSSLLAGALAYAGAVRPRTVLRFAVPLSVIFAAGSCALASGFNQVVALQGPVVAAMLGVSAERLLRVPRSRSTLGSRATGAFFALFAALWVFYAVAFPWSDRLVG